MEWFATECLWVENTDTLPWRLEDVFHYVRPDIGGDASNDSRWLPDVPNYYLRGDAWVDEEVGVGVGCWYAAEERFMCHYWQDPAGGFHADLREPADVLLEPGERWEGAGAQAFFFAPRDVTRAGMGEAIARLRDDVLAASAGIRENDGR